jgi:hypothetical protein
MWIATQDLPRSAAHPFYARLNQILEQNRFGDYVEEQCSPFYAPTKGRPSLAGFGPWFHAYSFSGADLPRDLRVRDCSARNYPHTCYPLCLTQVFGETGC